MKVTIIIDDEQVTVQRGQTVKRKAAKIPLSQESEEEEKQTPKVNPGELGAVSRPTAEELEERDNKLSKDENDAWDEIMEGINGQDS